MVESAPPHQSVVRLFPLVFCCCLHERLQRIFSDNFPWLKNIGGKITCWTPYLCLFNDSCRQCAQTLDGRLVIGDCPTIALALGDCNCDSSFCSPSRGGDPMASGGVFNCTQTLDGGLAIGDRPTIALGEDCNCNSSFCSPSRDGDPMALGGVFNCTMQEVVASFLWEAIWPSNKILPNKWSK